MNRCKQNNKSKKYDRWEENHFKVNLLNVKNYSFFGKGLKRRNWKKSKLYLVITVSKTGLFTLLIFF